MLDKRKTLDELLLEDSATASFAQEFLALYERLYGAAGRATAERRWRDLVDAKVESGDGIEEAQKRAIQELRVTIGAVEKKKGILGRIFGRKR
ncbi:MAG: hypothetical protein WB565_07220 [Acidimicrobiales bacterium]